MDAPRSRSWSIHGRPEITSRYEILDRVGSGTYADVYKARRISDGLFVALKEIHDYQSSYRELESLQILHNSPNIITLHDYFWAEDEDAVLVLEFLPTDLSSVIREAKKNWESGISLGEVKRWMVQILQGLEVCHRNSIVHRDLKPSNLLISADGVLKLADFGQSRILLGPEIILGEDISQVQDSPSQPQMLQDSTVIHEENDLQIQNAVNQMGNLQESASVMEGDYLHDQNNLETEDSLAEASKEVNFDDGHPFLATSTYMVDDPIRSSYSDEEGEQSGFTSCVGTRWFRAPELLYGSTDYGPEIDMWSVGCIFAELINLETLFPGNSDIDQLSRIISVLGNLTEEKWPGCSNLPDYGKLFFNNVEKPLGLEGCLPNASNTGIQLLEKLVCYDPTSRATASELLHDKYFDEEPLPVPLNELRVPSASNGYESSPGDWHDWKGMESDSDFEEFGGVDVSATESGYSIRFL